ncbi:GPR1/FUN34/YaaH family transporter [Frankia sp. Mgl5]|uniref:GPR1/FUN34/YaaH family transporter n=1 Tax=Frankia sp. Mgl5 TaxID=2933793 RepID=UPI00201002BB|nr:GPR1/FUN34/YaaH family transporter [Frankia sp. Mgl5]MCK9930580.1 GPR1/FUN34/YaaH family transporter [Frankia sp. Mgl5]
MTTESATVSTHSRALPDEVEALPSQPAANPVRGNPSVIGVPSFIAGAVGLALVDTGWIEAAATGAAIPVIMTATSLGLLVATVWAVALGQSAPASLFAVFTGFFASYAAFVLGLGHNWYNIPVDQVAKATELWLISWLVTVVLLTVGLLRLPSIFTLLLGLVDAALLLLLLGTTNTSTALTHAGGYVVFAVVAVATYLYVGILFAETGGKAFPLGKPVISG